MRNIPTIQQGEWAYGPEDGGEPGISAALSYNGIEFIAHDGGGINPEFVRKAALDLMKLANAMSAAGVQ
jgi:hypothetical protein